MFIGHTQTLLYSVENSTISLMRNQHIDLIETYTCLLNGLT